MKRKMKVVPTPIALNPRKVSLSVEGKGIEDKIRSPKVANIVA
jgi:hypothetical protein